jgi:hypothetical protein
MRTLVILPCSAKKRDTVPKPARAADLMDAGRRQQAKERLSAFGRPAIEMYTGTHYRLVREGMEQVWRKWGRTSFDMFILSAGYGLLPPEEEIIPYDVTFDKLDATTYAQWVAELRIREEVVQLVSEAHLAFFLLNGRYLTALGLPLDTPTAVTQIVLTDQESLHLLPAAPNIHSIVAHGPVAARRWHVKAPHVRGFLFGRLCTQIANHGPSVLEWLADHPQDTERLFYKRTRWRPQYQLWPTGAARPQEA